MAEETVAEETQTEEKPKAPKMPEQNGVRRPKPGTATGRVWEIADEVSEAKGAPAVRAEVLDVYVSEGGNPATGATQYNRWRKFHGLTGNNSPGRAPAKDALEEVDDAPEVE